MAQSIIYRGTSGIKVVDIEKTFTLSGSHTSASFKVKVVGVPEGVTIGNITSYSWSSSVCTENGSYTPTKRCLVKYAQTTSGACEYKILNANTTYSITNTNMGGDPVPGYTKYLFVLNNVDVQIISPFTYEKELIV